MSEGEQMPLFEVITEDEFKKGTASTSKSKSVNTDERTYTTWYKLPHRTGFCTVPAHDSVIRALSPEQKEYRQVYPVRMVFTIGEYDVCRDCFLIGADRD